MKKESWKKLTLVFIIIGCLLLVFSAFPILADYTPSSIGSTGYTRSIDIDNWDIDTKNAEITEIISLDPNALDQSQETLNGHFKIGLQPPLFLRRAWMAQSVKNDRDPLNGFYVAIARHGTPSNPIYLGIMYPIGDPNYPDNFNELAYLDPSRFSDADVFYWVGLDMSSDPIDIPPDTYFAIAVISDASVTNDNHWMLGASDANNPYDRGALGYWYGAGKYWRCDDLGSCQYDMCFTTYTVPTDNGNGESPVITITSNHQVISQVLGSLSFLGALIAGVKYKWFV